MEGDSTTLDGREFQLSTTLCEKKNVIAYGKSYMSNRLVSKWMTTFV